jgi:hypothetical protein
VQAVEKPLFFCGFPRFSQRIPQRFPHFLCKGWVSFAHEAGLEAGKVQNRRRFARSDASVDDVEGRLQFPGKRGRMIYGGLSGSVCARGN